MRSERHGYVPDPRPWGHRSACSAGNEVRIEDCLKQGKGERESEMRRTGEQKVLRKLWLPGVKCNGEALVVSQFTLFASYKKGNRPSWFRAGSHEVSIPLYDAFCKSLSETIGKQVGTGEFGADMKVSLVNDGPVTICIDTKNKE